MMAGLIGLYFSVLAVGGFAGALWLTTPPIPETKFSRQEFVAIWIMWPLALVLVALSGFYSLARRPFSGTGQQLSRRDRKKIAAEEKLIAVTAERIRVQKEYDRLLTKEPDVFL